MHELVRVGAEFAIENSSATRANVRTGAGKVDRAPFGDDRADAVRSVLDSRPESLRNIARNTGDWKGPIDRSQSLLCQTA
jgi:hypothetical protein